MRATALFDNLGPYHRARLRAGAGLLALEAVQISGRSGTYDWDNETAADAFGLTTLFPDGDGSRAPAREMAARVYAALNRQRPEVVFIPGWSSRAALAALSWTHQHDVPAVVMSESTAWDEPRSSWKEWIKGRLVTLFAAALVGGRPHADYVAQLGLSRDRVFTGYDAVDNAYFAGGAAGARADIAAVRVRHGLPPAYFLASARFVPKKNLPRLVQAYARYRELCAGEGTLPWSLVLLGDGDQRPALVEQVAERDLSEQVLLPGFRQYPDLPAYYGGASAFIHASTIEPWGLVVNEAMAAGLPVLVSDRCGCAADLVAHGRNGFTFDPGDTEKLAGLMRQLTSMPAAERAAWGAESTQIVAGWGPENFGQAMADAAGRAVSAGPFRRAGLTDRLLISALLHR